MKIRLASVFLMVGLLLASAFPAVTFSGLRQVGCVTILPRTADTVLQLCAPSQVQAMSEHAHASAVMASAETQPEAYLPLLQKSQAGGPGGSIAPYVGAPACPTHDPTRYHPIWDGVRGCHYDHEHGDDPALANQAFGPLGSAWGGNGFDHPFHTPNEHDAFKHRSHKITVRVGMPCTSVSGSTGCITDLRIMHHLDFFAAGTRFHSFWIEMRMCSVANPSDCGIHRRGGWLDFGPLIAQNLGNQQVAVPADTTPFPLSTCGASRRLHRTDNQFAVWYGMQYREADCLAGQTGQGLGQLQVGAGVIQTWAPLNLNDPLTPNVICPNGSCANNNSVREQAHIVSWRPQGSLAVSGRINRTGFTNLYGVIDATCTAPGPTCVPFEITNAIAGYGYQHRDADSGIPAKQYDVLFNYQPSGWITYPD
jgi:hypothetical protein